MTGWKRSVRCEARRNIGRRRKARLFKGLGRGNLGKYEHRFRRIPSASWDRRQAKPFCDTMESFKGEDYPAKIEAQAQTIVNTAFTLGKSARAPLRLKETA